MSFRAVVRPLLRSKGCCQYMVLRFKGSRKKGSGKSKKTGPEHALAHFDKFYGPVFESGWPSTRLALLSPEKYCVLVNNFADKEDTTNRLLDDGAENILMTAKHTDPLMETGTLSTSTFKETQKESPTINNEVIEETDDVSPDADIFTFMPTKRMGSEKERMKEKEIDMFAETNAGFDTPPISDTPLNFPEHLSVFAFERGNAELFFSPKRDSSGLTDYYLFNAASILPVLALDLFTGCNVLDLCSAPGGKMLTILQTHLLASITCVDNSNSRLNRLKQIKRQYVPGRAVIGDLVKTVCADAREFCSEHANQSRFDRVLVDVPCSTDRHVLQEFDNNLFKPSRLSDRMSIPDTQQKLLYHAIHACKPGGIIVYSTCTLSPVQNDGTIQATLEKIWQDTEINVAVVDTRHIADRFREVYNFADNTRFGQLVLPNVTANFGPMYFCKLKRLS